MMLQFRMSVASERKKRWRKRKNRCIMAHGRMGKGTAQRANGANKATEEDACTRSSQT